MRPPLTLGIDPGKTGALVWLDADGEIAHVADMPEATGVALGALVRDLVVDWRPAHAVVEIAGRRPGQRGSQTFAEGYGVLLGVLGAWDVPTTLVTSAAWKATAKLTKRQGETDRAAKQRARERAIETWPASSHAFARVKDTDRAEAALIARHGWMGGAS